MRTGAWLAAICLGGALILSACRSVTVEPLTPTRDRLDIRSVTFLPAKSPEFVIFVVTVDYSLASAAEGNIALALDLEPGRYTLVTEQRVRQGSGAIELLAECKRTGRVTQALSIGLAEYPGPLPRKTLASQMRTVVLPVAP